MALFLYEFLDLIFQKVAGIYAWIRCRSFDIDNKPVPNESTSYPNNPKMKFEQDWLRKPQKWMCGPIDLRWDYKRHVWTAPVPMKLVKLELTEHLCPEASANAVLYNDQEQYDYDGNPLATTQDCEKCGYEVKVWSNAMYPVPKGWRIMACFDTTLNRYQMINHDPFPIVEATIDGDMMCVDGVATIVGPAGDGNLDPCNALAGMKVDIKNTLNQPLCAPRTVFLHITSFDCGDIGDPGPTLTDCAYQSPQPLRAKGIILQAEFKPDCLVTHIELLEFYCWGYDVTCDEEEIDLYSQGDVETCWDWCVNMDHRASMPSHVLSTESYSHTHVISFSGISGGVVISGSTVTDNNTHNHGIVPIVGFGLPTAYQGTTDFKGSHTHNVDLSTGTAIGEAGPLIDGTTNADGDGAITTSGTVTGTWDVTGSGTLQPTVDNADVLVEFSGLTVAGLTDDGGLHTINESLPVTVNPNPVDIIGDGGVITEQLKDSTIDNCTVNLTGAYCYCSGTISGCSIVDDSIEIDIDEIAAGLSADIQIDNISFTHIVPYHKHNFTSDGLLDLSNTFNVQNGTVDVDISAIAGGLTVDGTSNQATFSGTIGTHTHSFTTNAWNVPTLDLSGIVTTDEKGSHYHDVNGTTPSIPLSGTVTIPNDTHSHTISIGVSGSIQISGATASSNTHNHDINVPCREVEVCSDVSFDIDIDSRFVPGKCTLRVSVMNKDFWEYYWYSLCVCSRALWHEGEMGPAICAVNGEPACDEACSHITCSAPTYSCPNVSATDRNIYSPLSGDGEDVSWFDNAQDSTLLDMSTNCFSAAGAACAAAATCGAPSVPDLSFMCANPGAGCGVMEKSGAGSSPGSSPIQGGVIPQYCLTTTNLWEPFLRDVDNDTFTYILDSALDHQPPGPPP